MTEIKLKFGGSIFIETPENKEEEDRIKVYDSDQRYLEYFIFDEGEFGELSPAEYYSQKIVAALESAEDLNDIFELLDLDNLVFSKHIQVIHDELFPEKANDKYFDTEDVTDNDYVNRIGDWYVLQKEGA